MQRASRADADGRQALDELLTAYWPPVYAFFRRLGADRDAASDLVQGLFAHLLEREDFATAAPENGRFRAFLATCARNWWANQRDRQRAEKRGGGVLQVSLSQGRDEVETWLGSEPVHGLDAAAVFERRWAETVIARALWQLEQDERAAGRGDVFAVVRPVLEGHGPARPWAALARELGSNEGALKVAAHRLKQRFRAQLEAEVRPTLADDRQPGDELRALLEALQAGGGKSPDSE